MKIELTKPVDHVEVVKTPVQLGELSLEFVLVNPLDNKLTLKVQPLNRQIEVRGEAYEAIKPGLEKALAKMLGPIIEAALNPEAK